ncbi:MAG: hypothetical protein KBD12_00305 [Candidatus Pacebacteria bacterium]|nr:hypothetical protein [Candidatus Paceibacterota bacterium]
MENELKNKSTPSSGKDSTESNIDTKKESKIIDLEEFKKEKERKKRSEIYKKILNRKME